VLYFEDLSKSSYHLERNNIFLETSDSSIPLELQYQTTPAPKLSNHKLSKSNVLRKVPKLGSNTYEILKEFNVDSQTISDFYKEMPLKFAKL